MSNEITLPWNFGVPADRDRVVWLMTIMHVAIKAKWTGGYGEYYVAWAEI